MLVIKNILLMTTNMAAMMSLENQEYILKHTYSLDSFHFTRCFHVVGSQNPEDDDNGNNNNKCDGIVTSH